MTTLAIAALAAAAPAVPAMAVAGLPPALLAAPRPPASPPDPFRPEALMAAVSHLASDALEGRGPGSEGHRLAREWITAELARIGCRPPGEDESAGMIFPFHSIAGDGINVLATLQGTDPETRHQYVVVSAHYDHLGRRSDGTIFPGADDDASGVAALLAIAESFAPPEARPPRSLLFAVTDLEERGLWGALSLTAESPLDLDQWVADVNLEVLGGEMVETMPGLLTVTGAEWDRSGRMRHAAEAAAQDSPILLRFLTDSLVGPRGDHHAFLLHGVPSVMIAAGTTSTYHTPRDVPSSIDAHKLSEAARFARDMVRTLAEAAQPPRYEEPPPSPSPEDARVVGELLDALVRQDGETIGEDRRLRWSEAEKRLDALGAKDALDPAERTTVQRMLLDALGWITRRDAVHPSRHE